HLLRDPRSWEVVGPALDRKVLWATVGAGAIMLLAERRRLPSIGSPRRRLKLAACALAYLALVLAPTTSSDALARFLQSAYHYHALELRGSIPAGEGDYPLVRTAPEPARSFDLSRAPHVLVVMIESFNAKYVEAETADGRPYTPVFNRLISRGWYVERFYGNSVQTAKGQFATLLSLIPSVRGRESVKYMSNRYHSLVQILRDHGYRTVFFQAQPNLDFDNTARFMGRIGFDECRPAADFSRPADRDQIWGWGPEDHAVYRGFFALVDERLEDGGGPIFATIATAANHVPFAVPANRRLLHSEPQSFAERYVNALALSDRDLAVFFDELDRRPALENTIVVVMGDHSYPTGDHGITNNEIGYYEESFRTPLLVLWPGHLAPRRVAGPYSQLDLAPTLLDLIGASPGRNHFQGQSLVAGDASPRPVYLVQPYSGGWLGVVDYPFKFLRRLRSGEEMLFDLAADPGEKRNLIDQFADAERLSELRHGVDRIVLTHHLIQHDRIWDGNGGRVRARPLRPVQVIAHRGNAAGAPENTLAAIDEAFDLGAHIVEVDVHSSRDGIPVVIHDYTVDRTTDGSGRVAHLTLGELRTLDAGAWKHPRYAGQRIPTLEEVLRRVPDDGRLLIDPKVQGLGRPVAEAVHATRTAPEKLLIGAWNGDQQSDFAKHLPGATILESGSARGRRGLLYFNQARKRGVTAFEMSKDLPAEFIVDAHAHGMPVYAFTINDRPTMRRFLDLGIDGIETDEPARLIEILAAAGQTVRSRGGGNRLRFDEIVGRRSAQ
ncbi:MAG: glycerophosphodiester phosphodiesterase family protein, partial [Candidatus Binatia bacterium]